MSPRRFAAGQLLFAFVITAVGAIKGYQLLVDHIADTASQWTGLS